MGTHQSVEKKIRRLDRDIRNFVQKRCQNWLTTSNSDQKFYRKLKVFLGGDQKKNIAPGIPCVAWF